MKARLAILIAIPWLIITGMIVGAYMPIFRGHKYLLPVKPRDPRDFFRGNYVDLAYDFSLLDAKNIKVKLTPEKEYRFGDSLYLEFENKNGTLKPISLGETAGETKNIRLKVQPRWSFKDSNTHFDLFTGLESFFAPQEAAEEWENSLQDGLVFAEVAIDAEGNARLVRLIKKPPLKPATKSTDDEE
jgi:uncharacterized membrane-anchored protein